MVFSAASQVASSERLEFLSGELLHLVYIFSFLKLPNVNLAIRNLLSFRIIYFRLFGNSGLHLMNSDMFVHQGFCLTFCGLSSAALQPIFD